MTVHRSDQIWSPRRGDRSGARCFVRNCWKDGISTLVRLAAGVELRVILCDHHRVMLEREARPSRHAPPAPRPAA